MKNEADISKGLKSRDEWLRKMEAFSKEAEQFQIHMDKSRRQKVLTFLQELIHWNARLNLTSITEPQDLLKKHILDSMVAGKMVQEGESLLDLGTGAGFPGIPIKILLPGLRLILVEATRKKVSFIQSVVRKLELKNTTVLWTRAEDQRFLSDFKENPVDVMITRAALKDIDALDAGFKLIGKKGKIILMKGDIPPRELKKLEKGARTLQMSIDRVVPYQMTGMAKARHLVVLKKDETAIIG
jgi:16S rRNA (guanine527-N7)-methyltransferase